jgi:hypothetical protein
MIIAISALAIPAARLSSASGTSIGDSSYVLVGGQNGTWFDGGQTPRLERVDLGNYSVTPLTPAPSTSSQPGTVWSGGWNGSQWLISGFGEDDGPAGSNPYIYLYDGQHQILAGTLNQSESELSWQGGDIFAASYNGKEWLLSGLGSGLLSSYNSVNDTNHMSLATFDGYNFTDLSNLVPDQQDGILYANAWNGRYWLVGGGYKDIGVLFSFDGRKIRDLTNNITEAVPEFGSVQALAWNGHYWLIGGYHFLAEYDGHKYTDLTNRLGSVLSSSSSCCTAVNAIAWNGSEWMLGGGTPVSQTNSSQAWLVTYSSRGLENLIPEINPTARGLTSSSSSILTITAAPNSWVIGGYSQNQGLLYEYSGVSFTNLSYLVSNYTYVNWVGAGVTQNHVQTVPTHPTTRNHAIIPESTSRMMSQYQAWIADTLHSFEMYRFD